MPARPLNILIRHWWRSLEAMHGTIGLIAHPPVPPLMGTVPGGHSHATPTLVVCLEGLVTLVFDGHRVSLQPGQALLVRAGVPHRHDAAVGSAWFGQGYFGKGTDIFFKNSEGAWWWGRTRNGECLDAFAALIHAKEDATAAQALVHDLRCLMDTAITPISVPTEPVLRMARRLWNGGTAALGCREVIAESGASRSTAHRWFRQWFGVKMHEEILDQRLNLSRYLLEGGASVSSASRRCGWNKVDTFSRSWRAKYGYPPSEHVRHALAGAARPLFHAS